MPTPEEKYYDGMNTLLAPVRWAKSLAQTLLLIVVAVGIGLFYPLILYCNGRPVTLAAFLISGLTILAVFTFCYTTYYFVFGGIAAFVAFTWGLMVNANWVDTDFKLLVFSFLVFGIVQKVIRNCFKPPKPKPTKKSFVDELNELPRCKMEPKQEQAASESSSTSTATYSSDGLSSDYATLGIRSGAMHEEVKQAYRDLVKVWHPDRFDGGDTRLKQKAEEQLKAINDAYARIQEARSQHSQRTDTAIEKMPLREFLLETQVFIITTTAKMTAVQTMMLPGFKENKDMAVAIQECSDMCNEGVNRLRAVIRRMEFEAPEYPTAEFQHLLATLVEQQTRLNRMSPR